MLAALLFANTAAAGPVIAAEVVFTPTTLGDAAVDLGTGYGARFGVPVDLVLVELIPEGGVTVWGIGSDSTVAVPEIGARFSVGKIIEPGLYGHVAYLPGANATMGWDAGATLELTLLPLIDAGVQGGVQKFGNADFAVTAGLQASLKL